MILLQELIPSCSTNVIMCYSFTSNVSSFTILSFPATFHLSNKYITLLKCIQQRSVPKPMIWWSSPCMIIQIMQTQQGGDPPPSLLREGEGWGSKILSGNDPVAIASLIQTDGWDNTEVPRKERKGKHYKYSYKKYFLCVNKQRFTVKTYLEREFNCLLFS